MSVDDTTTSAAASWRDEESRVLAAAAGMPVTDGPTLPDELLDEASDTARAIYEATLEAATVYAAASPEERGAAAGLVRAHVRTVEDRRDRMRGALRLPLWGRW